MAFVEDRQLLELSESPKKSLFPVLNRAEAMSPLILLLALMPPLYVVVYRTLTPLDAVWGLKAVAMATSDSADAWIDPAMSGRDLEGDGLRWQPPLSSWIVAGVMILIGTNHPLALVVGSLLGTSALILFVFGLSDRLRGPQFAWWTTCLVAMHGPILQGAQTPAPVSLTLAFSVAAVWGFTAHCQDSKRLFSPPLAWAGLAWGLCLLAGGPVAFVVVAILLLYVLSLAGESRLAKKLNGAKPRRTWKGRPALESLGLLVLIGFVVGGWWEIWMVVRHGSEFFNGWFAGTTAITERTIEIGNRQSRLSDVTQMGGALSGLTLLGVWVGLRLLRVHDSGKSSQRSSVVLLLAWMGLAALAWLIQRGGSPQTGAFVAVWRGFCLLPATLLAALAIEQIGTRRIGYFGVLFGLLFTVGLLLNVPIQWGFGLGETGREMWPSLLPVIRNFSHPETPRMLLLLWRVLFVFSLGAGLCGLLWRILRNNDFRQRLFLGMSLGLFVAVHGVLGFVGVRQSSLDDEALAHFREEMAQETGVRRVTIVAPDRSPLTLRYTLASLWPRAEATELASWYDPELTREIARDADSKGRHVVVEWNNRDKRTPTLQVTDAEGKASVVEFLPVGSPRILRNHRLRAYRPKVRLIPVVRETSS